jgi:hypothetical protein
MLLPQPGGPMNSRLCAPAAAISSARLAARVGEIAPCAACGAARARPGRFVRPEQAPAAQVCADIEQVIGGAHTLRGGGARLGGIGARHDELVARSVGLCGRGQQARHGFQLARETELAIELARRRARGRSLAIELP